MTGQSALGLKSEKVLSDGNPRWNGDHLIDPIFVPGVIFSNFKINRKNLSNLDIMPTILEVFDINVPSEIDGTSLFNSQN